MIILRDKNYSFTWLKNLFSSNKNQKEITKSDSSDSSPEPNIKKKVIYSDITFKEGYDKDYWPALVVLGIKSDETRPNGGWEQISDWMSRNGFFEKGGALTEIHPLSYKDNVNGKNGASATVLVFSNDTKISSGKRLAYAQNFKWPEDFFNTYNDFYTWYKSGKDLDKK